ncbi:MAG: phosphate ABC transporter substrate-binding protein [Anaerolineaceae bacterium]|jgi:phosphate transport system substrate-binding protein|nr:phosphate ABC transporter substrate-binding protein [Anaerolineaceae bacterium]
MRRSFSFIQLVFTVLLFPLAGCQNNANGYPSANQNSIEYHYLENKGSDTMVNLALYWAEEYQKLFPEIRISVTGGGSGTGISSLINNTVDLANASREITSEEIEQANKNGVVPIEYIVARDAIAVIVHPENPIDQLTLQDVSDIYSGRIENWSQLGGEDRPIVRLSRETNSGTHIYFLEEVIRLGNSDDHTIFSANTLLLPSSEGIIAEVRENPNAIGYDGLGYITEDVKVLKIAREAGSAFIFPTLASVNDNQYAISRNLFIYAPGKPTTFVKDYLDWILSSEGQKIVEDLGFIPVQ